MAADTGREAQGEDRMIVTEIEAISLEGMKKEARGRMKGPGNTSFTILCDEGAAIGGTDTAPTPLTYFAAGVAL